MVSTLLFYQLLLVALVLICLLVYVAWPDDPPRAPIPPPQPHQRRRRRVEEPKPFPGHKPLCAACEQAADAQPKAPGLPPPIIRCTRGLRRTVDTHAHFCPEPACSYHGWLGRGNIRSNGHPGGQPWLQLQCVSCQGYFSETHGTIFQGKRSSVALIVRVIACLAEGLGIRGTARVFEIDPNTVLQCLVEAAEQLKAFFTYFLHELHINQMQLDELYAVLNAVRDGDMSAAEAIERLSRSPHWVQPPRRQARGSAPKPRWMPLPVLLYAQVVKTMRRRRLVTVKHRVVFGTQRAIEQVLATCGWHINTSLVERLNLSLRQRVAAIRRRSAMPCKSEDGLSQQLALFQVYHNFVLPHASLRQALAEPVATHGSGSAKVWRPCMPAMAAGLTDHVWSLREVLLFRVPPWPQPQTV
jgi:hypothetical protein